RSGCPEMRLEQLLIACPAPGMPEGQAIEGRGIVRAIVGRGKRNPVAARQFPPTAFVEQLPRLSIPPVIPPGCLKLTQGRERPFGRPRSIKASHEGRHERIAAKER